MSSSTAMPTAASRFARLAAALACALLSTVAVAGTAERVALARAFEHGEGVERDAARAAQLYCEAARDGDAEGAYAMGWMYANGRGVPRDDGVAATMFAWAAQFGHDYAGRMLERLGDAPRVVPDCLRPTVPATAWGPPDPIVVVELPPAPTGPDPFADLPKWKQQVADLVGKLAPRFGVDTRLALSVIAVESNFDAQARSPKDARGLMQLIPGTAARFNVKDSYDPRQNVQGGLAYLRFLLAYYRGDVALAAAAYNAGEKAVDRYGGIPPYAETQAYVRKVIDLYRGVRHPFDPSHAPSPSAAVYAAP
ncbi:MAG TPA: transglycosylase SLT domain-containing protein [Casimicrobiaceae bacterium]|nr:transglycosylase SLT domain-containing protein [Casimicrobiaceae bacterium]